MTADPKALQYLFQTSSYNVLKIPILLQRSTNIMGNSILGNECNAHKRHRKAMLPAFGFPETKALTHIFQEKAIGVNFMSYGTLLKIDLYSFQLMDMWRNEMKRLDVSSLETNIHPWLTRATLDAIGEGKLSRTLLPIISFISKHNPSAAFGYEFGTMKDDNNQLGKTYRNML
jgi:hypothetical protein